MRITHKHQTSGQSLDDDLQTCCCNGLEGDEDGRGHRSLCPLLASGVWSVGRSDSCSLIAGCICSRRAGSVPAHGHSFYARITCTRMFTCTTLNLMKTAQRSTTSRYHGNGRSLEAFGSALVLNALCHITVQSSPGEPAHLVNRLTCFKQH